MDFLDKYSLRPFHLDFSDTFCSLEILDVIRRVEQFKMYFVPSNLLQLIRMESPLKLSSINNWFVIFALTKLLVVTIKGRYLKTFDHSRTKSELNNVKCILRGHATFIRIVL